MKLIIDLHNKKVVALVKAGIPYTNNQVEDVADFDELKSKWEDLRTLGYDVSKMEFPHSPL